MTRRVDWNMSRPTDPRHNDRRGADNQDTGYTLDAPRTAHGKRWPAPDTIYKLNAYMRQRRETGRCVVCGQPTDTPGATCKAVDCISAWVLGHTGGAT